MKENVFTSRWAKRKRIGIVLCLLVLAIVAVAAVSFLNRNANSRAEKTVISELGGSQIAFYADVTHDGADEKIVVDLSHVDLLSTGEEKTVRVISGGKEIWSAHADTVHVGWNGVYLYHGGGGYYLMLWNPYGCTGNYEFTYRVFSLSADGKEIPLAGKDFIFDEHDVEADPAGYTQKINGYSKEVNQYLSQSLLLVDTDGGKAAYSTDRNRITRLYSPAVLLELLGLKAVADRP